MQCEPHGWTHTESQGAPCQNMVLKKNVVGFVQTVAHCNVSTHDKLMRTEMVARVLNKGPCNPKIAKGSGDPLPNKKYRKILDMREKFSEL